MMAYGCSSQIPAGNGPVILEHCTVNSSSRVIFSKPGGTVPVREVEDTMKNSSLVHLVISAGMLPTKKAFSDPSKNSKLVQAPNSVGKLPEKLLPCNSSSTVGNGVRHERVWLVMSRRTGSRALLVLDLLSFVKLPKVVGIVPVK